MATGDTSDSPPAPPNGAILLHRSDEVGTARRLEAAMPAQIEFSRSWYNLTRKISIRVGILTIRTRCAPATRYALSRPLPAACQPGERLLDPAQVRFVLIAGNHHQINPHGNLPANEAERLADAAFQRLRTTAGPTFAGIRKIPSLTSPKAIRDNQRSKMINDRDGEKRKARRNSFRRERRSTTGIAG